MPPLADGNLSLGSSTIALPKTAPPKLWEGGVELGLNGSEGNSETFDLHFGAKLKRKTEFNILSSELDYKKNSSQSVETANKAFLESRFEHLFQESRWTCFVHNIEDYDEFKAYDLRVSVDAGLGYQLVKNDLSALIGRVGGGTTREIGGPDDTWIPEAVFGLEGEHKINKRQKLSASVEFRPDVTDFANYRVNMKAAWEVLLDEETHLSMKVSILDRYDSYADGSKPNDLDYALTLLWSF
jgi:putative salt-induced outer membrane protein YdiY